MLTIEQSAELDKWITELETTDKQQGYFQYFTLPTEEKRAKYCVFGVYLSTSVTMPSLGEMRNNLGLSLDAFTAIVNMNDIHKHSFSYIAQELRYYKEHGQFTRKYTI